MEIISQKERIDLGYAPRDPFAGVILRSQRPNSEVEFDDVFGGPPRRSSIYESRRSRADSIESFSRLSRGREVSVESHRSRLGLGEKPVFGEGSGSGRRRQLGDDFYRDIFQSSESACSSPRIGDRDALHSSPGSRVNSPNRPMALRLEPLVGGYSLPTQPSLSEKMAKGLDHPSFGSPTQCSVYRSEDELSDAFSFPSSPNASTSGFFTTQSVVGHGDLRNSGHVSSRQRPLSRLIPGSFEDLSEEMEPASQTVKSQTGKNSSSLEDYIRNQQFHFSMYKWAGKGVMLVMPSDSNEINGFEGRSTRLPEVLIQEVELPTDCDYFSRVAKAFKYEPVIQEKKSDKKEDDYIVTTAKDLSQAELGTRLLKDDIEKCGNQSEKASVPGFDENSNINSTDEKQNPEFNFNAHGGKNPELKCLSQLFEDDMDKLRSDDIRRHVNEREAQSKSQKKQQLRRESRLVPEVNRTTLHDTPPFSEDKARGNKVKGKVKEFIKKFNQEAPSKRKGAFAMLDRRSKGEGNRQDKADDLTHVSSIEAEELLAKSGNNNTPLFDILKENQVIEKAEVDKAGISCDGHMINGPPSEERIEVLHPQSGPTPEVIDNAACHEDIVHEDIAGYLVQQLPVNQTEGEQNSPQQEQIKNLDAKIRQWSKGKEGNIRSLLSTLQLVLWAESGWKQVPLVNIIEGPSVKKAYQKALLCLHPDKLQQKGASSNQKYIAEKVFDILQEAWDHFNSISEF